MSSSNSKAKPEKRSLSVPQSSPERTKKRKPKSKSKSKKTTREKSVTITLPPKSLSKSKSVAISHPPQSKTKDEKASQLKKAAPLLPNKKKTETPKSSSEPSPKTNHKPNPQHGKEKESPKASNKSAAPIMVSSKILPLLMSKAGNSPTNPLLDPKNLPVLKAAAKLSLRWPSETTESPIDLAAALINKKGNPVMLHEIRNYLEAVKAPALKQNEWPFKKDNEWASALNELIGGLQSKVSTHPTLPEKKPVVRDTNYTPIRAPHWNEVQTNWPGFEHKPLPNWMEYADPVKLSKSKIRSNSKKTHSKQNILSSKVPPAAKQATTRK